MKAIVFDMDGVLVDSEKIHQRSELKALESFGLKLEVQDLQPYAGASRVAFQKGISERFNVDLDWKAVFKLKDDLFFPMMNDVEAIPGVLELIPELKSTGFKLAIATSSQKPNMEFVIDKFNLSPHFDAAVCAADITHSKPHPEIFLKAAERLGVEPAECYAIEDSLNGVRSAKSAGMNVIGLTGTFPRKSLQEADRVIDGFDELNAQELLGLAKV